MAYIFTQLLQDIYTELGQLRTGDASAGSASALTDAALAGAHADGDWNNGTLFVTDAGETAPHGEFAAISGFDAASGELTLAQPLSAAIEEGDRYALASALYPLATLIELANAGLRAFGDIPLVDEQVLSSLDGHSSYVATLEWTRRRPLRIDYLAVPGLSSADPWRTVHDWDFVPAAPGGSSLILFAAALPHGRPLRVWYQAAHPSLRNHDDPIAGAISPELAVAAGVERALRWQNARLGGDAHVAQRWEQAQAALAEVRRSFPIWRPRRSAKLLSLRA
jgi:hypothetical protein